MCNYGYIRAPIVDVGYVPNAKYLAHIRHQTQKIGFWQMLHMLYNFGTYTILCLYRCKFAMVRTYVVN